MPYSDALSNSSGRSHYTWIVPAQLNRLLCIDDLHTWKADETSQVVQGANTRRANMDFVPTVCSSEKLWKLEPTRRDVC